jgi:hypothetical protein
VTRGFERNQVALVGDGERGGGENPPGDGMVENGKSSRKNIVLMFEGRKRR